MKKFISAFVFSCIGIVFLCMTDSCSKTQPAAACLNTVPSTASVGAAVAFSSCTSGASSYSWTFGDGGTATGQTATHTYTTAGTYTGTLSVAGMSNKNFTITVVANSLSFKGTSFIVDSVTASASGGIVAAYGSAGSGTATLDLVFSALPTASGAYTIINSGNIPVGQQLYVILYNKAGGLQTIYGSTGSGPVSATVTVSGGKIAVTLPATEIVNQSVSSDSASVSGTLTQTQ